MSARSIHQLLPAMRKLLARGRGFAISHPKMSVAVLVIVLLIIGAKVAGWYGASPERISFDAFDDQSGDDKLVVVLHGWVGSPKQMRHVADSARREYPAADILLPHYPANVFSNADPYLIANSIEAHINDLQEERNYDEIVLVGFSMGALLIRKVFLWGHGGPWAAHRRPTATAPHDWVKKVSRIVLLAGQNRGWSITGQSDDPRCRPMPAPRRFAHWVVQRFATAIGTGDFIMSGERGAPLRGRPQGAVDSVGSPGPRELRSSLSPSRHPTPR